MLGIFILVVSSVLSAVDDRLPSSSRWTDETDGTVEIINLSGTDEIPTADEGRTYDETMELPTPFYKEMGWCVMSDGWQNTILNVMTSDDGHVNVKFVVSLTHRDNTKTCPSLPIFSWKRLNHWVRNTCSPTQWMVSTGSFSIVKHFDKFIQTDLFSSERLGNNSYSGQLSMINLEFTTLTWVETLIKNTIETSW